MPAFTVAVIQIPLSFLLTSTGNQNRLSDFSFSHAEGQWGFFPLLPEMYLEALMLPNWGNLELKPRHDTNLY